ncbi:histidinol-phosphatase HisJ family protein [Christensenella intestinihominis]|nr:histidinol-phosphatase HisJ family protein [Christensenella intestinihominis]
MYDYHIHSRFSPDSTSRLSAIASYALDSGLRGICITDHLEFDECYRPDHVLDIDAYAKRIAALRREYPSGPAIGFGIEIGLKDKASFSRARAHIKGYEDSLDFVIGSVHYTSEGDAYSADFFKNRTRIESYSAYLECAVSRCLSSSDYDVLGHFDYPAKCAPYTNRAMRYSDNPWAFDRIFKHLIDNGIGLEINTSVYPTQKEMLWGKDILKRFVALGGEFVTLGSDAHIVSKVGWRSKDALLLAQAAGVPYLATFHKRRPTMHRLTGI